MTAREVIVDGVRYVPAAEVSLDVRKLLWALTATWWGWSTSPEEMEAAYLKHGSYLRVLVSDSFEDGEGQSLEEFAAAIADHLHD